MMLDPLQTTAGAAAAPDIGTFLVKGAYVVLSAAIAYTGREMGRTRKEMAEWRKSMTEWRVYLFGINGDNGLNGTVKDLDRRVDRIERRHGPSDRRHHLGEQ